MKKGIAALLLCLCLTGCGQKNFETMSDVWQEQPESAPKEMLVVLPADAASPTMIDDSGACVYVCQEYDIHQMVLSSGDLRKTVKTVTGLAPEDIHFVSTKTENAKRYDGTFCTTGESGQELCRITILDDGNYHYCLLIQAPADMYDTLRDTIEACAQSFYLGVSG
jgi:hypothetical protein